MKKIYVLLFISMAFALSAQNYRAIYELKLKPNKDKDSVITDYEDSLPSIEDRGVLCKAQNIIDVKMDKNTWLEKYENTVIINYPNGVGTIYKVVRRRDD